MEQTLFVTPREKRVAFMQAYTDESLDWSFRSESLMDPI